MTSGRDLLPGTGVREILREATREDHERLHRHGHFSALLDGTLLQGEYHELIGRLYGFYAPLDGAIVRVLAGLAESTPPYDYTRRGDMLAQDLRDFGLSVPEIGMLPRCERASGIVTRETLGGVLYVVEGATLGGSHLDRVARKILGHEDPAGRNLWAWCRSQNAQSWKMANRFLAQQYEEGIALEALEAGARDTFRVIADWLAPLEQDTLKSGAL